jgi:hypothetical protein
MIQSPVSHHRLVVLDDDHRPASMDEPVQQAPLTSLARQVGAVFIGNL